MFVNVSFEKQKILIFMKYNWLRFFYDLGLFILKKSFCLKVINIFFNDLSYGFYCFNFYI